jgi:hypothetical protein
MKITAVVAAVLCLVLGFAGGFALAKANARVDLEEVRFARTLGGISSSATTLLMVDERRADKIQALHENLLRDYAHDARQTAPAARHIGPRVNSVDESLGRAVMVAQRHGMKDAAADLTAVRQTLRAIVAPR